MPVPLCTAFSHRLRLGGFEDALEPPQEGERQNDLAVVGALVVTAQEVGDIPDEVGEFGEGHGVSCVPCFIRSALLTNHA